MSSREKEGVEEEPPANIGPRFYAGVSTLLLVGAASYVSGYLISCDNVLLESVGTGSSVFILAFLLHWARLCGSSLDCKRRAHFDEMNIVLTYKAPDRETRAMIAAEPRTPWEGEGSKVGHQVNQTYIEAMARTEQAGGSTAPTLSGQMTDFERRSKMFYDEGKMLEASQKMMEEEKLRMEADVGKTHSQCEENGPSAMEKFQNEQAKKTDANDKGEKNKSEEKKDEGNDDATKDKGGDSKEEPPENAPP